MTDRHNLSGNPPHGVGSDATPHESDLNALALRLIAQAHERESCLCRALSHWRARWEKRQRLRNRQQLVAQGFYDHRLRFTAYRAWRWAYAESCRRVLASRMSEAFREGRPLRRAWRAWRRWVTIARGLCLKVRQWEQMSRRRLLLGVHPTPATVVMVAAAAASSDTVECEQSHDHDADGNSPARNNNTTATRSLLSRRHACRGRDAFGYFTAWASHARARVCGRTLLAQWERRMRLVALRQWSRWTWCLRLPRRVALVALFSNVTHARLLTLWHTWIAQSRLRRLARWRSALDTMSRTAHRAAWLRTGECWRRWERAARLHRIAESAAVALQRRDFRVWLRLVLWRLKMRHDVARAVVFYNTRVQKFAVRRVICVAQALLDQRLANHFRDTAIPTRRLKECWRWWVALCRRNAALREDERLAVDLRASMLALLALRRMADAAERDKSQRDLGRPPLVPSASLLMATTPLHGVDPDAAHTADASPLQYRVTPARPLSNDSNEDILRVHHDVQEAVPTMLRQKARHPIPWTAALAAAASSPSPARWVPPVPFGGTSSASRSPSAGSQPGCSTTFTKSKEAQLRDLLARYKVMMSTADEDERLWAHLSRGSDSTEMSGASAQRLQLRQRAETRQMVRSQIAMLQKELRGALQGGHHEW